jgi:hypothetical protein
MELRNLVFLIVSFLTLGANAQFGFFDQMFNGGQQQQQQQQQQNVRSDSQWYQSNYESGTSSRIAPLPTLLPPSQISQVCSHVCRECRSLSNTAHCDKYLCPGTLSCVHFPHHCPCAWEAVEDKVELGEGISVCASKGGWKEGETARKIELARKGLL